MRKMGTDECGLRRIYGPDRRAGTSRRSVYFHTNETLLRGEHIVTLAVGIQASRQGPSSVAATTVHVRDHDHVHFRTHFLRSVNRRA